MHATAYVIEMPLVADYDTGGHEVSTRRGVIVEVARNGLSGWGEFVEIPGYSLETAETAIAALTGRPVTHSNPMAVAARRAAELDLRSKEQASPLTVLLGGEPGPVVAGAVIARFGDLEGLLDEARLRAEEGYRKLKIKVGPGFDVVPASALRSELPDMLIAADANGAYRPGEVPTQLDDAGLAYLEQPYSPNAGWSDWAELRSALGTPICLDESITGPPTLRSAIAAGACDLVNLKAARVAGLAQAVELHDLAKAAGLGLVAGGLLETGIGRAAALALARLPGFTMPADLSASGRYWERDLVIPPWTLEDGALVVPGTPGLGVEVDEQALDMVTIAEHLLPT